MTRIVVQIPERDEELRQPTFKFTALDDGTVAVIAETTADHIAAFRNVTSELDEHYWAQAAVAASLSKKYGNGEYGKGEMEKLAAAVELSPSYLFKIARTYKTFTQFYPRVHNLYFKHHVVASGYKNPSKALSVAVEGGMSANALAEWVASENRKDAKRITKKRQEQVKTDFLTHLEHVETVIEEDFIANCPSKDFAKRIYSDWLGQIKFELRQLLRGANLDKIRAAIEDEGAQTLVQIRSLTGLAMFDVEAAVAQMVAENEYEWIDRGGKKDDQRGQPEKILHKVGESDGTGFTAARPVNSYAH